MIILLALLTGVCIFLFHKNEKTKDEKVIIEKENEALSKYKAITNVEAHVEDLKKQAAAVLSQAKGEAASEIGKAADAAAVLTTKAKELSNSLIKNASEEAQRIARSALETLQKAAEMEKVVKAMKNVIDGYGDQYIIPTQGLIDELGESYAHTTAGNDLKNIRATTRKMIKEDLAATCDYVEDNRKDTAIAFIVDAFNGKVDSILSSAKVDNYGTLEQKIDDAFFLVNNHGRAFRDARITKEYLQNRKAELKCICTINAIKEKEREEQKRIREQLREEEKAVKEFEKAVKEAQKEETTIVKAMAKVQAELSQANEEQKAEYEARLLEMQQKLSAAEEKGQRAISMAQQTKKGHVYIISNIGSFGEEVVKIGMTRRYDPMDRIWELGDASVPFDFDVHALISSEDAPALERALHEKFSDTKLNRVNPRKEFFRTGITAIKNELESMKISVQWTMTAEAREYRESLALQKKSEDKKAA